MMKKDYNQVTAMSSYIEGKQYLIPSLNETFNDWGRGIHPCYQQLQSEMIKAITRVVTDSGKLKKLERDDYALCGAGMFRNANDEALRIMTLLVTWLFFFDDKVDHTGGDLFHNPKGFAQLAEDALGYVSFTLGLTSDYREPDGGLDKFILAFKETGGALKFLEEDKRRFFVDDFKFYLQCLVKEQHDAQTGKIRTFNDYMAIRRGTVCMYTICSATEFASEMKPPSSDVLPLSEMVQLWTEIRDLMIFVNDLYSFRNEIHSGNGASLATLWLEEDLDLQVAIEKIVSLIKESKERFNRKSNELLNQFSMDKNSPLAGYFDSLKALVTGYHSWCLTTKRYGLEPFRQGDDSFLVYM